MISKVLEIESEDDDDPLNERSVDIRLIRPGAAESDGATSESGDHTDVSGKMRLSGGTYGSRFKDIKFQDFPNDHSRLEDWHEAAIIEIDRHSDRFDDKDSKWIDRLRLVTPENAEEKRWEKVKAVLPLAEDQALLDSNFSYDVYFIAS